MKQLDLDSWNMILSTISTVVVIAAAIAGAIKYFQERKRDREVRQEELAWRKTQFILELADKLETDERYQIASQFLENHVRSQENTNLKKVLGKKVNQLTKTELNLRHSINHYLDFFDRLYHFTFVTHTLDINDVEIFGWYVEQINGVEELRAYAETSGFEDVLTLGSELSSRFGKKHWVATVRDQAK